jgi:hypothetical protein
VSAAVDPFSAWALEPSRDFGAWSSQERLRHLAAWALLAPSTHNTVPVRFRVEHGALEFWADRQAVLPESDPAGRQAAISVGCAVQNAVLAAAAYGFTAEVVVEASSTVRPFAPNEPRHAKVAALWLGPARPPEPGWLEAMRARRMVRAEYDGRQGLTPALVDSLQPRAHSGVSLHLLTDAPTRIALGKFQEAADATVLNRERFARELGHWLLPNDSASPVGMRGREFGLSDEAARHFHRGLRGEERLLPDETAGFAKSGNLGMRTATAVGVLTASKDDLPHRVAAGRAFEEIALRLVQAGWAVAMHAGITEVDAPNLALRGRLRVLDRPVVVFRLGAPANAEDGNRPHSSRPPLDDLWLVGPD